MKTPCAEFKTLLRPRSAAAAIVLQNKCKGPNEELLEFTVQTAIIPRDGSAATHAPVRALWR